VYLYIIYCESNFFKTVMEYEFGIKIWCQYKSYMFSHINYSVKFVEEKNCGVVVCRHEFAFKVHIIWYI
jgi:hypothetical protein